MSESLIDKRFDGMIPWGDKAYNALMKEMFCQPKVTKQKWLSIPSAFDTETTSFIDEADGQPSALLYIWMFGVGNTVVFGRHLDEFVEMVDRLNGWLTRNDCRLISYIHFAKFDFSFIKYVLKWEHVFLKENRVVLYADTGRIQFRDSLALAGGQSLDRVGKNLRTKVYKASGSLDYSLARHEYTPLTDKEYHYCAQDIRVLLQYIREKIEDESGDISQIPYTNTGYVRRYIRNACFEDRARYDAYISRLTMTPGCYQKMLLGFQGGSVAPNINYVGKVVENIHSYDIKSSYPYVMCAEYFPVDYFRPVSDGKDLLSIRGLLSQYCCLFKLELWGVRPTTTYYFPISKHKCQKVIGCRTSQASGETLDEYKVVFGSGRVISAMYLSTYCTELDLEMIERFYDYDSLRISDMRIAPRGKLPYPIIKSIVKFFNDKTTLDGVADKKAEYMISKNMLNAAYGMMVEKPVRPIYGFSNIDGFTKEEADFVAQVSEYNMKFNRFLFYPWGVWVTAHARYRLHDAIWNVGPDFRYCDTDSCKFIGEHDDYFQRVNEIARAKIINTAKELEIPLSYMIPHAPDGSAKCLGVWEHEWDAPEFKTLGAKRYLINFGNGKYELTVAGTNKKSSLEFILKEAERLHCSPMDVFNVDLVIPPEYAKRTISKYIDKERTGWIKDYTGHAAYYVSPSGVYIENTSYTFSITEELKDAAMWLMHEGHYEDGQI